MSRSLRTKESQAEYDRVLSEDGGKDLREEELVKEFNNFLVVVNRFPHDRIAKVHHLIVPKRNVATMQELNSEEELELKYRVDEWASSRYDCIKRNYPASISVNHLAHWHLYKYK